MLKILQPRLQQYVNRELPGIQAGFRKGRGKKKKEKAEEPEINHQHLLDQRKNKGISGKHPLLLH